MLGFNEAASARSQNYGKQVDAAIVIPASMRLRARARRIKTVAAELRRLELASMRLRARARRIDKGTYDQAVTV